MYGYWHECTDRSKPNVDIEMMSPYYYVQVRCLVFVVYVRNCRHNHSTLGTDKHLVTRRSIHFAFFTWKKLGMPTKSYKEVLNGDFVPAPGFEPTSFGPAPSCLVFLFLSSNKLTDFLKSLQGQCKSLYSNLMTFFAFLSPEGVGSLFPVFVLTSL